MLEIVVRIKAKEKIVDAIKLVHEEVWDEEDLFHSIKEDVTHYFDGQFEEAYNVEKDKENAKQWCDYAYKHLEFELIETEK
jgi:hypothetical protein